MSVFDQLAGQEEVTAQLRTAAQAARRMLAEMEAAETGQDNLFSSEGQAGADGSFDDIADAVNRASSEMTHAWLFTGPPGSGRSIAARCFAAALQCNDADLSLIHI